ncbi:hypothetical protein ACEQ8H_002997 [Pleosporales sp. CAS-2024a]
MAAMRIPQSYIQKCKVVGHVFQSVFIFVGLCLTLAVMGKDGTTGGATTYFLVLCFLSIPAIIYLVMVPMWSRAKRFANAYAFLALDFVYTILWFAASVAVAVWNSRGISQGAAERKLPASCTTFKFGSASKCAVSKASVGIGVIIFLLFALTTAVSAYYLIRFVREGALPYESKSKKSTTTTTGNPSPASPKDNNDAWSTEIHPPRHSDSDDRLTDHGGNQHEDEYALLHSTETDDPARHHPGRPLSWGVAPYAVYRDRDATAGLDALSPGGYDEYRRAAGAGAQSIEPERQGGSAAHVVGSGYSFGT